MVSFQYHWKNHFPNLLKKSSVPWLLPHFIASRSISECVVQEFLSVLLKKEREKPIPEMFWEWESFSLSAHTQGPRISATSDTPEVWLPTLLWYSYQQCTRNPKRCLFFIPIINHGLNRQMQSSAQVAHKRLKPSPWNKKELKPLTNTGRPHSKGYHPQTESEHLWGGISMQTPDCFWII